MLLDQVMKPGRLCQRQCRDQPPADTEFGSSKTGWTVCDSFTYEVSLARDEARGVVTPILQPSKGILVLRHAQPANFTGGSGLSRPDIAGHRHSALVTKTGRCRTLEVSLVADPRHPQWAFLAGQCPAPGHYWNDKIAYARSTI
jgi:hypothetical protein